MKRLLAVLVALLVCVSLFACNDSETETETNDRINIGETDTNGNVIEPGDEVGSGSQNTEIGDPGEYSYTECDQTVYVNNPDSAVNLRSADYEPMDSVKHGTELRRIGLSTDEANYWSKVLYNNETYYVASKFLTTLKNADEGFVAIEKTVVVNEETGSLNIRNLPTFDGSAVIGWAVAGTEYKVVAENTETGWYKIEFVPYGSETTAFGYIKSGADNFVKQEGEDNNTDSEPAADNQQQEAPAGNTGK